MKNIGHITLLVRDYNEAINFYCNNLNFVVIEDKVMSESKRWVLIAPNFDSQTSVLLSKAITPSQQLLVGNQCDGKVFLFLYTDDIESDFEVLKKNNVTIVENIVFKPHGKVLIFEDLYGNQFDLIQPINL